MKTIAWIGAGVMGKSMLKHLKKQGYLVSVYNRTLEKIQELAQEDIIICDNIQQCVQDADIICTMVGYPKDVESVYEQVFQYAKDNVYCIDFTTSSPSLAKSLYEKGKQKGFHILDAPVSGGDTGAKQATLSIMVGGDEQDYEAMLPIFECLGTRISYMGEAGNGQHTKACNQIAVAGAVAAMSEALVYAKQHNLDMEQMLNAIQGGAAGSWQLTNTAPRVLQEDFQPGFYIHHFIKDMHIIQEETNTSLDMLNTVCNMYETLADQGEANLGTQALIHYYTKFTK